MQILELAIEKAFYDLSLDPFDDQQLEEFLISMNVPKYSQEVYK